LKPIGHVVLSRGNVNEGFIKLSFKTKTLSSSNVPRTMQNYSTILPYNKYEKKR